MSPRRAEGSRAETSAENIPERPAFLAWGNLRLLMFSGKGGTGKTTASSATALKLARDNPERSILLISTDPAHSVMDSFAGDPLPANLRIVELDAASVMDDFNRKNRDSLRQIAARGTFLDEEDINRFLELSLPGMDELMGFLEISRLTREGDQDLVIVDTAPTGHTLRLLGMPILLRKWLEALDALLAKSRYMRKVFRGSDEEDELDLFIVGLGSEIDHLKKLLGNSRLCQFIPVMLAESLSVEETLDLVRELKRLGIGVRDVIVNRIYPESRCELCRDGRDRQLRALSRLPGEKLFAGLRLWGIPVLAQEIKGLEALSSFWKDLVPCRVVEAPARADAAEDLESAPIPPRVDNPPPLPGARTALLVFAGKGGVGKTTLACATALRLAQARDPARKENCKRILLFSADPAHSVSDCLGVRVGPLPTPVLPGLWAMEVDSGIEFESLKSQYRREVKQLLVKLMPNLDLAYDREVMERLMDLSPPGIDELMAVTSVIDMLARGQYDILVLDAAPTGHLIRLLELPQIIEDWLKAVFGIFLKYRNIFKLPGISERLIRMSRDMKNLRSILHDPERTSLYAVSILTDMAFAETEDLLSACTRLDIPVRGLFLNQATPDSEDPLCASIFERECRVGKRFASSFPDMRRSRVFRHSDPRGCPRLAALGALLYEDGDRPVASFDSARMPADPEVRDPDLRKSR
jgi:arsenite-transporting ATPase